MRRFLPILVLFLVPSAASAETIERSVKANTRTAIAGFFSYELNTCYRRPIPDVIIRQPPSNGSFEIQVHETTLGKDTTCPGMQVRGPVYIYTPKKGFKGVDEVTVNVPWSSADTGVERLVSFTYRITVE
jgi:hypothetical protein